MSIGIERTNPSYGGISKVAIVKTDIRSSGIDRAITLLGINPVKNRAVLLKPNFNTEDDYPGSTHNDTLVALIEKLFSLGALEITIGERSGPADTETVMKQKGIFDLCAKTGIKVVNFEKLPATEWIRMGKGNTHWRKGFLVARPIIDAECVVTTCCLKTHGFGGVFTMSLKLSVGAVHKKNMTELHTSLKSMRKMIAETNIAYSPSLIVLDGIEAFVDGGPMNGRRKSAGIILAGTDRVAIDAVGLAVLKDIGSNRTIMEKRIFEQEQISRAVELGLGIDGPDKIELLADDSPGRKYAEHLSTVLMNG